MPTISISPAFMVLNSTSGYLINLAFNNTFNKGTAISYYNLTQSNVGNAFTRLQILQGTVPTDFSTLTLESSRSADVLATWWLANGGTTTNPIISMTVSYQITPTAQDANVIQFNTVTQNATATGTATWFRYTNWNTFGNPGAGYLVQFIGTVGTIGSGADLEMVSTAITTGSPYKVTNLRISLPYTYTY